MRDKDYCASDGDVKKKYDVSEEYNHICWVYQTARIKVEEDQERVNTVYDEQLLVKELNKGLILEEVNIRKDVKGQVWFTKELVILRKELHHNIMERKWLRNTTGDEHKVLSGSYLELLEKDFFQGCKEGKVRDHILEEGKIDWNRTR